MATEKGFLKGLIFRLVKKHISGGTADSAIRAALKLNENKIPTAITFLNENPRDSTQVRYNLNTYLQLVRQISRLHAKADVSVRPSQLGYYLGNGSFSKNLEELLAKAKDSRINVWVENEGSQDTNSLLDTLESRKNPYLGIELPISKLYDRSICNRCKRAGLQVKISTYEENGRERKPKTKKQLNGKVPKKQKGEPLIEEIVQLLRGRRAVLSSPDEKMVYRAIKRGKAGKKEIVFETLYGFSPKKVRKLRKDNINVSIYIPYGKDWVPFAIKRLTEGHIRDIAVAVLDGEAKRAEDVDNGKGDR